MSIRKKGDEQPIAQTVLECMQVTHDARLVARPELVWTLEDAVSVVRDVIYPEFAKSQLWPAITGSVLIDGGSPKDLDIMIYNNMMHPSDQQGIVGGHIENLGWTVEEFYDARAGMSSHGYLYHCWITKTKDGRRVDFLL